MACQPPGFHQYPDAGKTQPDPVATEGRMVYVGCMPRHFTTIAGLDDAPFPADYEGAVKVVGTVYAGQKLNGVLIGEVEKDGQDAADQLAALVTRSRFAPIVQLVM